MILATWHSISLSPGDQKVGDSHRWPRGRGVISLMPQAIPRMPASRAVGNSAADHDEVSAPPISRRGRLSRDSLDFPRVGAPRSLTGRVANQDFQHFLLHSLQAIAWTCADSMRPPISLARPSISVAQYGAESRSIARRQRRARKHRADASRLSPRTPPARASRP